MKGFMQSNALQYTSVPNEKETGKNDGDLNGNVIKSGHKNDQNIELIWGRIIVFGLLHLGAVYGVYLMITSANIYTGIFAFFLNVISKIGITAGAHRLWAHRAYKATLPLRILLMIFFTIPFQFSVIHWARDHRVHHKYSDTDADPYNASRGFFFSHVGWLLCKKHQDVKTKGKEVDISDLENDPVLRLQNKYYEILALIFCFILPTFIPVFFWNESLKNAWFVAVMFRWTFIANTTWSVNSFAHLYGNHPYDRFIKPAENKLVSIFTLGEGWHNFHHAFPRDYKTSELGNYGTNITTLFIDCMAKIGWAYDLKTVTHEMVEGRIKRTGDGTHQTLNGVN